MHPPRRPGLTARFAVAGFIAFATAVALLAVTVPGRVRTAGATAAERHASSVATAALRHQLSTDDVAAPMRGAAYDRVLKLVRARVLGRWSIVRVKIWRPDGTIVFSDARRLVGRRFQVGGDPGLAAALRGATAGAVSDLQGPAELFERSLGPALFVTDVPLYLGSGPGRTTPDAVVQLYADDIPTPPVIGSLVPAFLMALGCGIAVLFALMLPSVYRASRSLRDHAVALRRQTAAFDRLLAKERTSVYELMEANRRKDEFVANVSHELRTPLTAIIGYIGTLARQGDVDPEIHREFLQGSLTQANRLRAVVENLLAAATSDRADPDLTIVRFGAAEAVTTILDGLGDRRGRVSVEVARDLPPMRTDRTAYQQVLSNLIDNALKFSAPDAPVQVSIRTKGSAVVVDVTDRGVGVPQEALEHIFERFYQADSSATRRHGGLGLGLAIVRDQIRMLGGTVGVTSEPGRGSTFTVSVPAVHPTAPDAHDRPPASGNGAHPAGPALDWSAPTPAERYGVRFDPPARPTAARPPPSRAR